MSEQLQLRRGSVSQVAGFIGAQGECVVDTTNNRLVVSDNSTPGRVASGQALRSSDNPSRLGP